MKDDACERLNCIHGNCKKNRWGRETCECDKGFEGETCADGKLYTMHNITIPSFLSTQCRIVGRNTEHQQNLSSFYCSGPAISTHSMSFLPLTFHHLLSSYRNPMRIPLFLCPWGFHVKAKSGCLFLFIRKTCPSHLPTPIEQLLITSNFPISGLFS